MVGWGRTAWTAATAGVVLGLTAACAGTSATPAGGGGIQVVAAENSWGSIAAQLGGSLVQVDSVLTNPNADPHDYESNTNDARAFATAGLVILNGAGYDDWARKLLDANPSPARRVLDVAVLLGKRPGDNPHFWYQPDWVARTADAITAEYGAIDPGSSSYFSRRRAAFASALQPYEQRLSEIKGAFAGTPVGATESIFVYLAQYLGLDLVSPHALMNAVSESNDPPAASVAEFENQISQRRIKVLVYNVQTASSVTTTLRLLAARAKIPPVGVSETLQPASATFQAWQEAQLAALEHALQTGAQAS